jgi:multidrug efflux pump
MAGRRVLRGYRRSLAWCLRHQPVVLLVLAGVVGLNVYLYTAIPKGFFPQQDTAASRGFIQADQATSFQAMQQRLDRFLAIVRRPGGGERHRLHRRLAAQRRQMFITLKPLAERRSRPRQVIARLREQAGKTSRAPTCSWCRSRTSALAGGKAMRNTSSRCRPTTWKELRTWEPRIRLP